MKLTLSVVSLCEAIPAEAGEQPLKPGQSSFKDCANDCPEMVVIPAGSLTMGSPEAEPGRQLTEAPQHNVTIGKPFAVSKFQVTFAEWDTCGAHGDCILHVDDRGWGRGRQPVINVSWVDAQRYVAWLSKTTGKIYRLLTEAEYEYAARRHETVSRRCRRWNNANSRWPRQRWDVSQTAPSAHGAEPVRSTTWSAMSGSG